MKQKIQQWNSTIQAWMFKHADSSRAEWWLSVISFLEASLIPLPPSTFMLAMIALSQKKRWIYLAALTTVTSVLGGLFGYLLGSLLFETVGEFIINVYNLSDEIAVVGEHFAENAFLALFLAAFTPIPYKVFTIGAGFFFINPFTFILASFIGRGLRFFLVAFGAKMFGEHFAERVFRYFALATIAAVVLIGGIAIVGAF